MQNVHTNGNAGDSSDRTTIWKRFGAFVLVAVAIVFAITLSSSNLAPFQESLHNYVRTNGNARESKADDQSILQIAKFESLVTMDEAFVEKAADFVLEREGFDEGRLYPHLSQNTIKNIFSPTEDFSNYSTFGTVEDHDGDRHLTPLTYPVPEYLYPLPCNEGVSFDCTTTPLSSLPVPTSGPLVIECGTCVYVDIADDQELNLDNGLRIEGKLYFPPEASLTISTIYVMVLGILKMDTPLVGNQVKFHLKGEENQDFVASDKQDPARTGRCIGGGCNIGKKAIAVVGGK